MTQKPHGSDVERSCRGKDAYPSKEHARAVALMNGMDRALSSYECRHCGMWHLTRRRPVEDDQSWLWE